MMPSILLIPARASGLGLSSTPSAIIAVSPASKLDLIVFRSLGKRYPVAGQAGFVCKERKCSTMFRSAAPLAVHLLLCSALHRTKVEDCCSKVQALSTQFVAVEEKVFSPLFPFN
jgi:hypothetical protein